jgi:hypothetical protein
MTGPVEEELHLSEPEERILAELIRGAGDAMTAEPARKRERPERTYAAGRAHGALEAILMLRGLNPDD